MARCAMRHWCTRRRRRRSGPSGPAWPSARAACRSSSRARRAPGSARSMIVQRVRDEVLRHRHLALKALAAVDLVGGVEHHQLALVELHRRVGDHPLDPLLLREQRAVREALERAVDHHLERDLGLADPAHAVREARRAPAGTGRAGGPGRDRRACLVRDAQVGDPDLAVVAAPAIVSMSRTISHPGREVHEERASCPPAAGRRRPRCTRSGSRTSRPLGAGDEPLVTVDHPVVAVLHRAVWISVGSEPATSGSVIAKQERTRSVAQRPQVLLLLLGVAQWRSVCMLPSSGACGASRRWPGPSHPCPDSGLGLLLDRGGRCP